MKLELFFKEIKQNLRIKTFVDNSENHKFLGEKDTARICLRQALVLDSSLEFAVEHLRELEEKV